jgi:hypothetical protein
LNIFSDDSDDEFEDVPEKEGFEASVPDHLMKESGKWCRIIMMSWH